MLPNFEKITNLEEREKTKQEFAEMAKARCEKVNDIIDARNDLLANVANKLQEQIVNIGSDFLISQI